MLLKLKILAVLLKQLEVLVVPLHKLLVSVVLGNLAGGALLLDFVVQVDQRILGVLLARNTLRRVVGRARPAQQELQLAASPPNLEGINHSPVNRLLHRLLVGKVSVLLLHPARSHHLDHLVLGRLLLQIGQEGLAAVVTKHLGSLRHRHAILLRVLAKRMVLGAGVFLALETSLGLLDGSLSFLQAGQRGLQRFLLFGKCLAASVDRLLLDDHRFSLTVVVGRQSSAVSLLLLLGRRLWQLGRRLFLKLGHNRDVHAFRLRDGVFRIHHPCVQFAQDGILGVVVAKHLLSVELAHRTRASTSSQVAVLVPTLARQQELAGTDDRHSLHRRTHLLAQFLAHALGVLLQPLDVAVAAGRLPLQLLDALTQQFVDPLLVALALQRLVLVPLVLLVASRDELVLRLEHGNRRPTSLRHLHLVLSADKARERQLDLRRQARQILPSLTPVAVIDRGQRLVRRDEPVADLAHHAAILDARVGTLKVVRFPAVSNGLVDLALLLRRQRQELVRRHLALAGPADHGLKLLAVLRRCTAIRYGGGQVIKHPVHQLVNPSSKRGFRVLQHRSG